MQRSIEFFLKRKTPPKSTVVDETVNVKKQKSESTKDKDEEKSDSGEDVQERIRRNREAALAKLKAKKVDDKRVLGSALEPVWKSALSFTMSQPYFKALEQFIERERKKGTVIYPPAGQVFSAFNHCGLKKVKVVIIGQDPYHGPRQAHGMCFSVAMGVTPPPSLKNIFQELKEDIPGFTIPTHGCLEKWAQQGVFLLNTILTVERGRPASHRGKGWEMFTDAVIKTLNARKSGLVFLLWGGNAKAYAKRIGKSHHVLTAAHPSPLSANKPYGGWFGCKHFSKTNSILVKAGKKPIDWKLDD